MKKISAYLLTILLTLLTIFIYVKDKELDDIFPFLDKGVGTWEKTPNMTSPRDYTASAVLMADGNVLISGGHDGHQFLETAEIYYPKENVFKPTGSMNEKRYQHFSFLLNNGEIVIVGGNSIGNKRNIKDVEIYKPKEKVFVKTDELPELLLGNCLLSSNGYIVSQNAIYNPITKKYKDLNINYFRIDANSIEAQNSIYTIDGWVVKDYPHGKLNKTIVPAKGDGYILTNSVERYNFENGSYSIVGNSVLPKRSSALIKLPNSKILIVGGDVYKASGTGSDNGLLEYSVYRKNIYPKFKKQFKQYWWWKNKTQYLELYDTNSNTSKIVGQKLKYAFGAHKNSDLILLQNRYVYVANGLGRRDELIDTKTWINYPVKKIPHTKLKNSIVVKLDENSILFLVKRHNKSFGYIFRLN